MFLYVSSAFEALHKYVQYSINASTKTTYWEKQVMKKNDTSRTIQSFIKDKDNDGQQIKNAALSVGLGEVDLSSVGLNSGEVVIDLSNEDDIHIDHNLVYFVTNIDLAFIAKKIKDMGPSSRGPALQILSEVKRDDGAKITDNELHDIATALQQKTQNLSSTTKLDITAKGIKYSLSVRPAHKILLSTLQAIPSKTTLHEDQKLVLRNLSTMLQQSEDKQAKGELTASFEKISLEPVPAVVDDGRQEGYNYANQTIDISPTSLPSLLLQGDFWSILVHEMVHAHDDIYRDLQAYKDFVSHFSGEKYSGTPHINNAKEDIKCSAFLINKEEFYKQYIATPGKQGTGFFGDKLQINGGKTKDKEPITIPQMVKELSDELNKFEKLDQLQRNKSFKENTPIVGLLKYVNNGQEVDLTNTQQFESLLKTAKTALDDARKKCEQLANPNDFNTQMYFWNLSNTILCGYEEFSVRNNNGCPRFSSVPGEFIAFYGEVIFKVISHDTEQAKATLKEYFEKRVLEAQKNGFVINDEVMGYLLKVNKELSTVPGFESYTNIAAEVLQSVFQEAKLRKEQGQKEGQSHNFNQLKELAIQRKNNISNISNKSQPTKQLKMNGEQQQQQEHQGHQGDLQISQQQQLLQQQASITKGLEDYKSIVKQFGYSNEKEGNAWLALKDSMIKYQSNDLWYKQKCEEYDQLGKKRLQADPPTQNQNNLRRYGKGEGESEMIKGLVKANAEKGAVLEEMRRMASGEVRMDEKQGEKRSGKVGQVELLGEVHDEHGASVQGLIKRMEDGKIEHGTVVALERKEGGEHLGMRDVLLLAEVLRYNEGCKEEERIALPAGMEETALLWDAKLVNEAQKHGVQVVGVEGKDLTHGQHSPEYSTDREDHMAQQLAHLAQQGYNVVMPVGEAHVHGLQARLSANAVMEIMQQSNEQDSQSNGQSTPHATPITKKIYGKFTEHLAKSGIQRHGIV